jgi:hypothetical protein
MKVYLAKYNDCTFESTSRTLSVHLSREGAEKAVQQHKDEVYKEWDKLDDDDKEDFSFDWDKSWGVSEVDVLP